jgi:hypothetical protein
LRLLSLLLLLECCFLLIQNPLRLLSLLLRLLHVVLYDCLRKGGGRGAGKRKGARE